MIIAVFGNINAGKSSYVQELGKQFPEYPILTIDDYRRRFGDGSFEADAYAIDQFVKDAANSDAAIIECTGLGPLGEKLASALNPKTLLILYVKTSQEICLARISTKDYSMTPYPPFSETLENTISRIHSELENDELKSLWVEKAVYIQSVSGETDNIPGVLKKVAFSQYHLLCKISNAFAASPEIKALIWFGSGPRGDFTVDSDIDLFIWTDLESASVLKILEISGLKIVFGDNVGKKTWLISTTGIVIELYIYNELERISKLYSTGGISDHRWSVLKGSAEVLETLEGIPKNDTIDIEEIKELLSEAFYYYYSLRVLVHKKDRYKYYFHCNILIHRLVQLRAIERGNTIRNYLPLYSEDIFGTEELSQLSFGFDQELDDHLEKLDFEFSKFVQNLNIPGLEKKKYIEACLEQSL